MKKQLLFGVACLLLSIQSYTQTLTQPANWPNSNWSLTGTYSATALVNDPTGSANFSYDDDAAGSGSTDILEATSPAIDLTAAFTAGDIAVSVTFDYNYNFGSVFNLEYYDADAASWIIWGAIADNSSTTSDWCGNIVAGFTSTDLSITGFTANQLSNFQYRFSYDASSVWGWGFCLDSPTIESVPPPSTPPSCTNITSPSDAATGIAVDGTISFASSADALSYDVYLDQNTTPSTLLGNTTTTSIDYTGLLNLTTYYVQIVPKNNVGDAIGCTITSFTTVDPPPANDECDGAIGLTVNADLACGTILSSSNEYSTASSQADDVTGTPNTDVWYSFTATSTEHVIELSNVVYISGGTFSSTDMGMGLYDGSGGCSALTLVTDSDPNSMSASGLTVGTLYYLRVYNWSSTVYYNSFDVCVGTPPAPPANNDCAGAIALTESTDDNCGNTVAGTTENALNSAGTCSTTGKEVWYSFVPATTGNYNFTVSETFDSGFSSTYVTLWDGSCGALTQIGSTSCFVTSINDVALMTGITYYVIVRYSSSTVGQYSEFDLCAFPSPPPPANDECENATTLVCNAPAIAGTTNSAVLEDDPIGCASEYGVWYTFTGDGSEVVVTSDADTGYDHEIDIFSTDSDCDGSFTQVICKDGAGSGGIETHTFTTTPGVVYFVYVAHYSTTSTSTGNFTIGLECNCAITDISSANMGNCNPADNTYTVDVTVEYAQNPSSGMLDINGELFAITGSPQTETLTLAADGQAVDVTAEFTDDTACSFTADDLFTAPAPCSVACDVTNIADGGNQTACVYDNTSMTSTYSNDVTITYINAPATGTLDVTINGMIQSFAITTSPQTVTLVDLIADGNDEDVSAAFSMDPSCTASETALFTAVEQCAPPSNDVCGAETISCGTIDQAGTTSNGTDDNPGTCSTAGDGSSAGVWYTFIGNGDEVTVTVNADPGNANDLGDSQLAVYSGSCAALVCETGNDDNTPPGGAGSQVTFSTLTGTNYYIYVDGFSTNSGDFLISVECVTPFPPIANAGGIGLCQNATPTMVDGTNAKVNLLVAGEIIAAISSTEDLGMVDASFIRFDATDNTTRDYTSQGGGNGYDMIDRSIVITPTNQPTAPVTVYLYYTDAEYDEIIANTDGDNAAFSWSDLGITKFDTDECSDLADPNSEGGALATYVGATAVTGGWEVEIEVSSFSGFQAAEGATALPIELNRFTAKAENRYNMIEWSTTTELNVQDHTLMKSDNASDWTIVGIEEGYANSNNTKDYKMIDLQPFTTTYYQLMTTDFDGSVSYSPIVSVERNADRESAFLGASPVPTMDVVNLNVYSQVDDRLTISLIDISGKTIQTIYRSIAAGNHQLPLDLSDRTNGVYIVNITSDNIQQSHRVIKN